MVGHLQVQLDPGAQTKSLRHLSLPLSCYLLPVILVSASLPMLPLGFPVRLVPFLGYEQCLLGALGSFVSLEPNDSALCWKNSQECSACPTQPGPHGCAWTRGRGVRGLPGSSKPHQGGERALTFFRGKGNPAPPEKQSQ